MTIKKNQVHITTEEYSEVTILGKNKTVVNLFEYSNNIRVTQSIAEQQFYSNRKFYIVNGIHMIMAIYGYSYLLNKEIPLNDGGNYHLSVISDIKNLRNKMELFIAIQSMRLLLKTDRAILEKLFSGKSVQDIYDVLITYGKMSLSRIESTKDTIMRVLDLNDIRKLEGKFKQRIEEMVDFVTNDLSLVVQLKLSGLPSDANIYSAVIELQKMSNELFLKLLGSIQDK